MRINELNLAKGLDFNEETLLHEFAHLISPPFQKASAGGKLIWEHHGRAWRAIARELGCEYVGKRRDSSPVREAKQRKAKYFLRCSCRGPDGTLTRWYIATDRGIAKFRGAVKQTCRRCKAEFKVFKNKGKAAP